MFNRIFAELGRKGGKPGRRGVTPHTSPGPSHRCLRPAQKGAVPRRIRRTKAAELGAPCGMRWRRTAAGDAAQRGGDERLQGGSIGARCLAAGKALLGDDKHAGWFRNARGARGIAPCIPSKVQSQSHPSPTTAHSAVERHKIENLFGKLKDWRRIHTHATTDAHTFFSAICIAATVIFWINQPGPHGRARFDQHRSVRTGQPPRRNGRSCEIPADAAGIRRSGVRGARWCDHPQRSAERCNRLPSMVPTSGSIFAPRKLPDEVVAFSEPLVAVTPSDREIRCRSHQFLTNFGYVLTGMGKFTLLRRMAHHRRHRFLDLQEQRIIGCRHQQHDPAPPPNAADADHLDCCIHDLVLVKQSLPVIGQRFPGMRRRSFSRNC